MPMWPQPTTPAADRVRALHAEVAAQAPTGVASAPATWTLIGEHTDLFGGSAIVGLHELRAAAAVSPRKDGVISVHIRYEGPAASEGAEATATSTTVTHTTSMAELTELDAAQAPKADEEGQPIIPPAPVGGAGQRAAGMVWMMVNRQMLSRDTSGMDLTVVCDIPRHAGLGADEAVDVALALALLGDAEDINEAPLRARLADVCAQSATLFSRIAPSRPRLVTALRGSADAMSVIDYADNSVTTASSPLSPELAGIVVAAPTTGDIDAAELTIEGAAALRERIRFVGDALRAFGADNLHLLPDAQQRVIEWLTAVHEVHGPEGRPGLAPAAGWLAFFDEETDRAESVARALRSRKGAEIVAELSDSQRELAAALGIDNAEELAQLVGLRGAQGARAAAAGVANSVIAYVANPNHNPANVTDAAQALGADGLDVIVLTPGEPARAEALN